MVTLSDIFQHALNPNSYLGNPDDNAIQALAHAMIGQGPLGTAFQNQIKHNKASGITQNQDMSLAEQNKALLGIYPPNEPIKYGVQQDAYGNLNAYNPYNPGQSMQVGPGGPFSPQPGQPAIPGQASAAPVEQLTGDAFLQSIPAQTAMQVKALAEGRMQFPGAYALKTPYWQQMIAAVSKYDPSFDAVNFNSRSATRKDFTSGKSAQNITSLNTALGHVNSLLDNADALKNTDYPMWNSVANSVANATGDPRIKQFDTTKDAVADELTRVFRGTGGSVSDVQAWKEKLNAANSPAQFKGVASQMADLLASRLDALGTQYNQGMGTSKQGVELLSPKAQQIFNRLSGEKQTNPHAQATSIKSDEDYNKLESGAVFTGPDGKLRRKP